MCKVLLLFLTGYCISHGVVSSDDVEIHMMSFNIRTSLASTDAGATCSDWNGIRKENVVSNIKTVAADFVGTQETSDAQKVYLDAHLAGMYSVIGETTGSLNGNAAEWNAMYYRSDTWTPLTSGMFWLGPDPNVMSAAWGMKYYRTCVWGRFQHIDTSATICVLNTHYETPGNDEAQENGARIILERIKTNCHSNDNLIVLLGDFNALKSYSAMKIMFDNNMNDPSDEATFCGDMLSATCSVKYDFTLFRAQNKDACYLNSETSRINYNGCYSSDHASLIGTFCLQGSCCSNSSSQSSDSDREYDEDDTTYDSVGRVQARDTEINETLSRPTFSSDAAQTASTSASGGSSSLVTAASILSSLGVCGLVALVVIRRKKKLDKQADMNKSFHPNASEYLGAIRAVSTMSALSPFPKSDDDTRVSNSTIPELAAMSSSSRLSTSSSVTASESEMARYGDCIPELALARYDATNTLYRPSSTAVMNQSNSDHSSTSNNCVIMHENDDNESIISYSSSSVSSYGYDELYRSTSSMALSTVHFSEIFVPESCVSDDSMLTKSQADFTKL